MKSGALWIVLVAATGLTGACGNSATVAPAVRASSTYGNARFGFSCDVPASFRAQPAPGNGDGFGYKSPDGQAQILCFGQNNVVINGNKSLTGTNARQAYALALASHRSQRDSVTYSALVGKAITVSGISRDSKQIYYQRILWGAGSVDTLLWSYPHSMANQLQAAVEHSAATFRPGDLSSSH